MMTDVKTKAESSETAWLTETTPGVLHNLRQQG